MYKVRKVLNNNAVVVIDTDSMQESILIGTGIGFQKKTNMILDADLTKLTRYVQEKGVDVAARAAKNDAVYLEAASEIITLAASTFDQLQTMFHRLYFSDSGSNLCFAQPQFQSNGYTS